MLMLEMFEHRKHLFDYLNSFSSVFIMYTFFPLFRASHCVVG